MKHRFLVHALSHTFVVVDITSFSLPGAIQPLTNDERYVHATRFKSWRDAEQHLTASGAKPSGIEEVFASLKRVGVAVLTIV